jgi:hypothetical protein
MAAADGTVRANEFHRTCWGNGDGKHALGGFLIEMARYDDAIRNFEKSA